MSNDWIQEFRERVKDFAQGRTGPGVVVSIKVRATSGCFHREHSPRAYRLIDDALSQAKLEKIEARFEEHESGPEILAFIAVVTSGLVLAKSIIELVTAIIKARSEGIKHGDRPSEPIELIVRGFWKDGEYFEEKVLHIPSEQITKVDEIARLLKGIKPPKSRKRPDITHIVE